MEINEVIDNRYKIVKELGEGGMAIVYKAIDQISDKEVTIKIIKDETMRNSNKFNKI